MEPYVAPLPIKPLAANETWTGAKQDRLSSTMIRRVRAEIWAPQAGTLYLDHWDKQDGSDVAAVKSWPILDSVTVPTEWVDLTKRFFRWRFVNGATAQTGMIGYEEKIGRQVVDVAVTGRTVTAAGKKADADGTDKSIPTDGFQRLILDCSDCTAEMTFTIDEAIAGATKPIYIKPGTGLDINAEGAVLHYSGAGLFRYILV